MLNRIKWNDAQLIDAQLLAVYGLYETLDNVKWNGGYKFFVKNDYFCHELNERHTYRSPLLTIRIYLTTGYQQCL